MLVVSCPGAGAHLQHHVSWSDRWGSSPPPRGLGVEVDPDSPVSCDEDPSLTQVRAAQGPRHRVLVAGGHHGAVADGRATPPGPRTPGPEDPRTPPARTPCPRPPRPWAAGGTTPDARPWQCRAVRPAVSYDDVEALEVRARTPAQHRDVAATLARWAQDPHPDDDDAAPAQLLVAAGDHLRMAGDVDGAPELCRRAVDAQGPAHPEARVHWHRAPLDVGRTDQAHEVADQLRRSAPTDGGAYEFVEESYESAGDLARAHRWSTLGVTRQERLVDDGRADRLTQMWLGSLLRGRWRVRRAMGLPLDEDDEAVGPPPAER